VDLQATLPPAFPQARILIRGLVQGPPVDAPVELRLVGSDLATLRVAGDELRAVIAALPQVTVARTTVDGGAPKLTVDIDEAKARLLGLDLAQVARQMEAGLEGVTGGSLLEGTEELPVRVRLGAGLRADPVALATCRSCRPARRRRGGGRVPPCRSPPSARCGSSRPRARSPAGTASG
jgi:multidrug efflux pump subunit AcrB